MHLYLWRRHDTIAGDNDEADAKPEIIIRAIRHHDDHRPLSVHNAERYRTVDTAAGIEKTAGGQPWTDEQLAFAHGSETIRFIDGTPGSGKTTALWLTTDAHPGETVLYLTWSENLVEHAREHFESFAPETTTVLSLDFRTFVETVSERPVARGRPRVPDLHAPAGTAEGRQDDPAGGRWCRRPEQLRPGPARRPGNWS